MLSGNGWKNSLPLPRSAFNPPHCFSVLACNLHKQFVAHFSNVGVHIQLYLLMASYNCCCRMMLGRLKMLPQLWQAWRVSWNRLLGVRSSSEPAGPSVSISCSRPVR